VGEALGRLLQRLDEVEAPDSKGPGDGDRLQGLSGEMNLTSIELASLAGPHVLMQKLDLQTQRANTRFKR